MISDYRHKYFANSENSDTFALLNQKVYPSIARMAESVDALVSNTSGAIRAGSIPAPGTTKDSSFLESFFRTNKVQAPCYFLTPVTS